MMRAAGRALTVLLLMATLGGPSIAHADGLRPEFTVDRSRAGRPRVVGYLYNDNDLRNAANVRLRVEQLTPAGAVSKVYQSFIVGDVLSRTRSSFDVPVSEPDGTATYRVLVESVDWFMECR